MGKKNKETAVPAEIVEIQDEAREDYELRMRMSGLSTRRKKLTIYTDASAGEELGYAEDEGDGYGLKTGRRLRKGLVGDLDALEAEGKVLLERIEAYTAAEAEIPEKDVTRSTEIQAEMAELKSKIESVKERLKATSHIFKLHSLPEIIKRDIKRKTREELGIKGKGIPEARQEDYDLEYGVQHFIAAVESWTDVEKGEAHTELPLTRARIFRDYLPEGQYPRIERALLELSYEVAIGNAATDDADF